MRSCLLIAVFTKAYWTITRTPFAPSPHPPTWPNLSLENSTLNTNPQINVSRLVLCLYVIDSGSHPFIPGGDVRGGIRRAQAALGEVLRDRVRRERSIIACPLPRNSRAQCTPYAFIRGAYCSRSSREKSCSTLVKIYGLNTSVL